MMLSYWQWVQWEYEAKEARLVEQERKYMRDQQEMKVL